MTTTDTKQKPAERGDGTPYVDTLDDQLQIGVDTDDLAHLSELADDFFQDVRLRVHENTLEVYQAERCHACIVHYTIPIERHDSRGVVDMVLDASTLRDTIPSQLMYADSRLTIYPNSLELEVVTGHRMEGAPLEEMETATVDTIDILEGRFLPRVRWPPTTEPSDYTTTVEMDAERFVGALRGVSTAGNYRVRLSAYANELWFEGRAHIDRDPIMYPYHWRYPADVTNPGVSARYSASFTTPISKHLNRYEDVVVRFGQDYPIEITQGDCRFVLAPAVHPNMESDDDD